jgi:hypothetical protein
MSRVSAVSLTWASTARSSMWSCPSRAAHCGNCARNVQHGLQPRLQLHAVPLAVVKANGFHMLVALSAWARQVVESCPPEKRTSAVVCIGRIVPRSRAPSAPSRRAIQSVDAKITTPPSKVDRLGTSANNTQPNSEAQTSSRNFTDCVAEMSAMLKERVRQ